jgi:hypothetical protein
MSTHSKRGRERERERERERKVGSQIYQPKDKLYNLHCLGKGEKNKYRQKRKTNEKVSHNKLVLRKKKKKKVALN